MECIQGSANGKWHRQLNKHNKTRQLEIIRDLIKHDLEVINHLMWPIYATNIQTTAAACLFTVHYTYSDLPPPPLPTAAAAIQDPQSLLTSVVFGRRQQRQQSLLLFVCSLISFDLKIFILLFVFI